MAVWGCAIAKMILCLIKLALGNPILLLNIYLASDSTDPDSLLS